MTPQYSTLDSARLHATKRPALKRTVRTGALCALVGLAGSMLVAPTGASAAPFGVGVGPFEPGSVVVSQGGAIFGGSGGGNGVEANGNVDVYRPNANGDVAPEASFTNGMYGPTTIAFDPSGDLWVANENTSDLFELTKAQLAMPNPVPAVTIFAESGALANPFGMAFDQSGNLWVDGSNSSRVYEYTKSQLAMSGAPTPRTTISDFPSTPLSGVAFDASGDLWISADKSVVEFSKAELAKAKPAPTVTISSSGGAQLVFDSSGDLWMVTGGGPDCYGTPCTNQVVEFTKTQLSTSGSPTPAVTISSTNVGSYKSLDGPYSLAFDSFGDLWVENFDDNTTVEFGKDQLSTSGSPTPVRAIVGPRTGMNWPSYVAIEP
jgi:sugar lactone lactonase YvrE